MVRSQKNHFGFSLVEVILAVGLFGLFATALIGLLLSTYGGNIQANDRNVATLYAQQGIEAVWSIRRQGWNLLDNGQHGLSLIANRWQFQGSSDNYLSKYNRIVSIEDACRDSLANIVDCSSPGATVDLRTKKAIVVVSYTSFLRINNEVSLTAYLTIWQSKRWLQTDWFGGPGQSIWLNSSFYEIDDGNLNFSTSGEIKLNGSIGGSCGRKSWEFDNASDYLFDSNDIQVANGWAELVGSGGGGPIDGFTQGIWHLDEVSGTILDYSGNNNHLTNFKGSPQYLQSGRFNTSLNFNGNSSAYINSGSQIGLGVTGAITIDAWIYKNAPATGNEAIVSKWRETGNKRSYALVISSGGFLEFWVSSTGSDLVKIVSNNTIPLNSWVHVAGVYDGNNIYVFINGSLEGSLSYNLNIKDEAAFFSISGADRLSGGDAFFNGRIDEVRVSNTARWTSSFSVPIAAYGSGVSYPTNNPWIKPNQSYSVGSIDAWTSFYETAEKNGGEIYYQLSDDDGLSWKYWNGLTWILAGISDHNSADIINANIGTFPTSTNKIMFRAFLSSNGSQSVSLDKVVIACSKDFDWPFDYADDYLFDSNKIEFFGGLAQLKGTSLPGGPISYSNDVGFTNIDWHFLSADNYVFDSNKIEVAESFGQLKMTITASGATTNSTFDLSSGGWTYVDWSQDTGDPDATGTWYGTGGNPNGFVDVNLPSNLKNKVLGGYWQQPLTTTASNPAASCEIDWKAIALTLPNGGVDQLYVAIYVENVSGPPQTTPVLRKDFTSTFDWESHSGLNAVDCSSKFGAAGTYYYKVAVYLDAKNQNTGPIRVGFDNAKVTWQKVSYPVDSPTIYPIDSISVTGVTSWLSFTETAVKNGGEIYYQLSNDDGLTWQYWNGSSWALATLPTNYNTASIVNTNIPTFSIVNEKIKFRAFLVSNGNQFIRLDRIVIGFDPTIGQWSYSGWDVDVGEVNPTGSNINNGGNPKRWVDIYFPAGAGDQVGGYWSQQFVVPYAGAESKIYFDYQVLNYNPTPITFKIYAFVDNYSGEPILGQEVWSSSEIVATQGWTSVSGQDASFKVPSAGTYYYKLAAWLETPGSTTGPFRVGFDNAYISWQARSQTYPSDSPSVSAVNSLNVANLDRWSSFSETAQKNGGEIYYQLSNDEGLTWQYWDGASWSSAGAGNYSLASEVNNNISLFSTSTGKITFKSFLSGNGSQQVKIDNVRIGWNEAGNTTGYEPFGYFVSSAFKTGTTSAMSIIEWDEVIPVCNPQCEIKLQLRTAPDNAGVPGVWSGWCGSSGLNTYFTQSSGSIIDPALNYNSWIQYRAELVGDTANTPSLQEIRIDYLE